MDGPAFFWHYPVMRAHQDPIPDWQLYGERGAFPDILHLERIRDRAAGLDWRIAAHRHAQLAQVFVILRGAVDFDLDGRRMRPDLPALIYLPPGVVHGFAFAAGTDGWVLTLPVADHPEIFAAPSELAAISATPLVAAAGRRLRAGLARLERIAAHRTPLRRSRLRGLAITLACEIFDAAETATADPRLTAFRDLVARHHAQHWPLARYAQAMGLSPRSLSRLCRGLAGQTPQQMIEAHLMNEACRLLAYTRLPAQGVAYQLGYQDPAYFARRFRKLTGASPGAYRRRLAGEARAIRSPGTDT